MRRLLYPLGIVLGGCHDPRARIARVLISLAKPTRVPTYIESRLLCHLNILSTVLRTDIQLWGVFIFAPYGQAFGQKLYE